MVEYYVLRIWGVTHVPARLQTAARFEVLHIGVNATLTGVESAACLETRELAALFRKWVLPRMRKAYGPDVRIDVDHVEAWGSEGLELERVKRDSKRVRELIITPASQSCG